MSRKIDSTFDFQSGPAKIINLPAPTNAGDAVNKAYADAIPSGLSFIERPVRVAATGNVTIASAPAQIDGVALNQNDRVLLWQQTNATQNMIYQFNGTGNALTPTSDQFQTGSVVFSESDGATNANIGFILTTDNPQPGTGNLTWVAAFRVISPGTGLQMSGNVISLTSPVAIPNGGTGATTAQNARQNLGAATSYSQLFGDGVHGTFTFASFPVLVPRPVVMVYSATTGAEEDVTITVTPGAPNANGVYTPSIVVTSELWGVLPPASNAYQIVVVG